MVVWNKRRRHKTPSPPPPPGAHFPPPPVRATRGAATWVPAGGRISVGKRLIPGGMVYVGIGAKAAGGYMTEPCLVNPSLKVNWNNPDWGGDTMGYWPSYSDVSPRARSAYLSWLAEGRQDEDAYIGYVFLFFYGLERRVLRDFNSDIGHPEVSTIIAEVKRLVGIYGKNRSFSGYAGGLLDYIEARRAAESGAEPVLPEPANSGWEVPAAVRVGIGRYAAKGQGIPAEWSLCYLRSHPDVRLRTPATRCRDEFDELFKIRHRTRYSDGMKVRRLPRSLKLSYHPASAGFSGGVSVSLDAIPDLVLAPSVIAKLEDLGAECEEDLDAYSRFLGRRPGEAGTAGAVALLPDELFASHGGQLVDRLRSWVTDVLGGEPSAVVSLDELVERWSPGQTQKLAKRDAVSLASLLGKIGVGLEPDVRFGASTPKPGSNAVLFSLLDGATSAPSPEYTAAVSLVHLTAVVAAADGSISPEERQHLAGHAERVLGLDAAERARMDAHISFLASGKLGMAGMRRKVEGLPAQDRAEIGRFLIGVAAADGVVSPEEIVVLVKLFGHLGLDETDVYSQVHGLASGDAEPVTVRGPEPETRWKISEPPPTTVTLDPEKIQARLAETARVASLLTGIFADDDTPGTPAGASVAGNAAVAGAPGSDVGVPGREPWMDSLDDEHARLAAALAAKTEWDRGEAEELAMSLGLPLLNGAFDAINEAAIDACGEPLVESGDDPLELNAYALEELF